MPYRLENIGDKVRTTKSPPEQDLLLKIKTNNSGHFSSLHKRGGGVLCSEDGIEIKGSLGMAQKNK